ncbi:hypothetical protein Tco_0952045 [Tanacetum coccineum]|uniref:Uncharacterized protein n=1 Tax=Tanacetum coccineum TaxID=301880 RepID=A0ABQ5DW89_9ASTR
MEDGLISQNLPYFGKKKGTNVKGTNMDNSFKVNKVNTLSTSNSFDAFNNMEEGVSSSRKSQEVDDETGPKTSQWNEDHESDTEVDEFIFPEGDKFGDQFDIRLKGYPSDFTLLSSDVTPDVSITVILLLLQEEKVPHVELIMTSTEVGCGGSGVWSMVWGDSYGSGENIKRNALY